jgi:hypothetical protein
VTAATKANYSPREFPCVIWALGFVSMLMDVSFEMTHAPLPVCPVSALGASIVSVDVINGIVETTPSTTKIFSHTRWDVAGPKGTSFAGACFAFLALAGFLGVRGQTR